MNIPFIQTDKNGCFFTREDSVPDATFGGAPSGSWRLPPTTLDGPVLEP